MLILPTKAHRKRIQNCCSSVGRATKVVVTSHQICSEHRHAQVFPSGVQRFVAEHPNVWGSLLAPPPSPKSQRLLPIMWMSAAVFAPPPCRWLRKLPPSYNPPLYTPIVVRWVTSRDLRHVGTYIWASRLLRFCFAAACVASVCESKR